jgi:hypothetical protein
MFGRPPRMASHQVCVNLGVDFIRLHMRAYALGCGMGCHIGMSARSEAGSRAYEPAVQRVWARYETAVMDPWMLTQLTGTSHPVTAQSHNVQQCCTALLKHMSTLHNI